VLTLGAARVSSYPITPEVVSGWQPLHNTAALASRTAVRFGRSRALKRFRNALFIVESPYAI